MERFVFNEAMNGVFAAFSKPVPRQAVLDEAYKVVQDWPDEFIYWAADKLKEKEALKPNIGRELKLLFPAWEDVALTPEEKERRRRKRAGDENCPDCHGEGWFYCYPTNPKLYKPGLAPYAIPCKCNTLIDDWDNPPRKASLQELKESGRWTMRPPQRVRNGDPKPLGFSLRQLLDRLHAGVGIQDEPEDPRRRLPEQYQ